VVVAKLAALEGRGLAREPVGLDVPAKHVHSSTLSPCPFPLPFSGKVVIRGGLAFWGLP
jgi:hypothetical protein